MQKISQTAKIVASFSVFLLCIIVVLGFFNHVGLWNIFLRSIIYVPLFAAIIFLIVSLWKAWGSVVDLEKYTAPGESSISDIKGKGDKTQASNLGRALDIKEESSPLDQSHIEPEKAAKVIRKMLAEDKD